MLNNDKIMYFCTRACICFMTVMMLMVMGRILVKNLFFDKWNMRNAVTDFFLYNDNEYYERGNEKASVNWEEKYPFEIISTKKTDEPAKKKTSLRFFNIMEEKVSFIKKQLQKYCTSLLIYYEKYIELAVKYEIAIGWECYVNGEGSGISIGDGYFVNLSMPCDVSMAAEGLQSLQIFLKSENIDMIYAVAPSKVNKYQEPILSPMYRDNSNDNLDANVKAARESGIVTLDFREMIQEENLEYLPLFFKTDHHWKPQTGLWAAEKLGDYLNQSYQFQIDTNLLQLSSYHQKIYKNQFLGSTGRKVTLAKAQAEDIVILTPEFETSLSINGDMEGNFENTVINYDVLSRIDYYNSNPYTAYGDDVPLLEIHNQNFSDGKKILMIKDSFGNVVVPFLALGTEYVSAIDLRHFTGSLRSYIKEYQPDVVIVLYSGVGEIDEKAYASHTSSWDFR